MESNGMSKIQPQEIVDLIEREDYVRIDGTTTTLCIAHIRNATDFQVVGKSACLNPADFDEEVGRRVARDDVIRQLWGLEGYHRARCHGSVFGV